MRNTGRIFKLFTSHLRQYFQDFTNAKLLKKSSGAKYERSLIFTTYGFQCFYKIFGKHLFVPAPDYFSGKIAFFGKGFVLPLPRHALRLFRRGCRKAVYETRVFRRIIAYNPCSHRSTVGAEIVRCDKDVEQLFKRDVDDINILTGTIFSYSPGPNLCRGLTLPSLKRPFCRRTSTYFTLGTFIFVRVSR